MKPELGSGFLRSPPTGWVAGRARAVASAVSHRPEGTGSASQSCRLDAEWEIQVEGQEPYRFHDTERTAPLWCMRGGFGGKRFYQVRFKSSHGLQGDVENPVYVNPENREDIWVDWDAAYDAHVEAWERINRIDLAKARRSGKVEGFFHTPPRGDGARLRVRGDRRRRPSRQTRTRAASSTTSRSSSSP